MDRLRPRQVMAEYENSYENCILGGVVEEYSAYQSKVLKLTGLMNSDQNDGIFDRYTHLLARLCGSDDGSSQVFVYLADDQVCFMKASSGMIRHTFRANDVFITYNIAYDSPDVMVVKNTCDDSRFKNHEYCILSDSNPSPIVSFMASPIQFMGAKIGMIGIVSYKAKYFSSDDKVNILNISVALSDHISDIIEDITKSNNERAIIMYDMLKSLEQNCESLKKTARKIKSKFNDSNVEVPESVINLISGSEHFTEVLTSVLDFASNFLEADLKATTLNINKISDKALFHNKTMHGHVARVVEKTQKLIESHVKSSKYPNAIEWDFDISSFQHSKFDVFNENFLIYSLLSVVSNLMKYWSSIHVRINFEKKDYFVKIKSPKLKAKSMLDEIKASLESLSGNLKRGLIIIDIQVFDWIGTEKKSSHISTNYSIEEFLPELGGTITRTAIPYSYRIQKGLRQNDLESTDDGVLISISIPCGLINPVNSQKSSRSGSIPVSRRNSEQSLSVFEYDDYFEVDNLSFSYSAVIIDDNVATQKVLKRQLMANDCSVAIANNGKQGLNLLKSRHFNIVFVDLLMPVINGLDMLRQFNKLREDAPSVDWDQSVIVCHLNDFSESYIDELAGYGMDFYTLSAPIYIDLGKIFELLFKRTSYDELLPFKRAKPVLLPQVRSHSSRLFSLTEGDFQIADRVHSVQDSPASTISGISGDNVHTPDSGRKIVSPLLEDMTRPTYIQKATSNLFTLVENEPDGAGDMSALSQKVSLHTKLTYDGPSTNSSIRSQPNIHANVINSTTLTSSSTAGLNLTSASIGNNELNTNITGTTNVVTAQNDANANYFGPSITKRLFSKVNKVVPGL